MQHAMPTGICSVHAGHVCSVHVKHPLWRNREPVQESRYLTDAFGEEAAAFIGRQRGATKPFFLYLAFNAVHPPLPAKENDERRFADITDPNSLLADGYPEKPDASDRCQHAVYIRAA